MRSQITEITEVKLLQVHFSVVIHHFLRVWCKSVSEIGKMKSRTREQAAYVAVEIWFVQTALR